MLLVMKPVTHWLSRITCLLVLLVAAAAAASSQTPLIRKIAFTYGATSSVIAIINEDGSGQTRLTSEGFNDRNPSWSPDGREIVFQSNRYAGRSNIFRMNIDGSGLVPLTDFTLPFSSTDPSWSPDGTKIVFVSDRGGARRSEIWVMNADGTNLVQLTTNIQFGSDINGPFYSLDLEPSWSPDGSKIVFRSNRDGASNPEIYSMNANGSNLTRLTNNAAEDSGPAWAPDGQHIAFSSRGGGRFGIYLIDTSGGDDHLITPSGNDPSWSPDGSKIVFNDLDPQPNNAFALYLINSDGSNRHRLTNNGSIDSVTGVWQTTGGPAAPPPPGPLTYGVSGRVVDISLGPNGPGVPGVTVTLTGSMSATSITDANGNFFIGNLPENGSFTLTPSSQSWSLFPTSRSFSTSPPFGGFVGRTFQTQFDASPIYLQFTDANYSASEGSSAIITVARFGFTTGTSTIDYATSDGTAAAGSDYVVVSGTLRFNPGESQKSFTIPIIYDKIPDPGETVNLTLTNPTGSTARGRQTAVLTIADAPPQLIREEGTSRAAALNAHTWMRDPFALTTSSFLGENLQTRVALFVRFVDLLPSEDLSAVTVRGFTPQQSFQLPVEFVGPANSVSGFTEMDGVTQINVLLPGNLPAGDLFLTVSLRGLTSDAMGIRIK
jgi:Tol biopolymer transport system component